MTKIGSWAFDAFKDFYEHHGAGDDLLHMLRDATQYVQGREHVIEDFRSELGDERTERELTRARFNAKIAATEQQAGYPRLHAQSVILLWGGLEAFLMDFLGACLVNSPDIRSLDVVRNLKIGLGEYESLDTDERASYLLERLEDKLGTRRAGGIERFEAIFRAFGMSSEFDSQRARDLLELSATRNLLVHRRGIVDARYKRQCPWTKSELGTRLVVSHDDSHRYFDAVDLYVFEASQRVLTANGLPRTSHSERCRFHSGAEPNMPSLQPTSGEIV